MPDISMCNDSICHRHETCYRFKATPDKYAQSYFTETPRYDEECDYYWDIGSENVGKDE